MRTHHCLWGPSTSLIPEPLRGTPLVCKVHRTVACRYVASSHRCLAALVGEGKRTGQGRLLPPTS